MNQIRLKTRRIIFSILIFLGLFLSFKDIALADCGGVVCKEDEECKLVYDGATEEYGSYCRKKTTTSTSNTESKESAKISFIPQIPFGEINGKMDINGGTIGFYITEIYKYAVSIVGILASIVIMWGGVRWLTAGGNQEAVSDAKKWIEGALSGLVLMMTSYMILYFVNPDLTNFKLITITPIEGGAAPGAAGTGKAETKIAGDTCDKYPITNNVIDFKKISTPAPTIPTTCSSPIYDTVAAQTGVDAKLLRAISANESSCNVNTRRSTSIPPACGIMQMKAATARQLDPSLPSDDELVCRRLESNADGYAVKLAAQYIKTYSGTKIEEQIAGYHGGYATSGSGPLAPSKDCNGYKKYECCKDPQDLITTQDYVAKVMATKNALSK